LWRSAKLLSWASGSFSEYSRFYRILAGSQVLVNIRTNHPGVRLLALAFSSDGPAADEVWPSVS